MNKPGLLKAMIFCDEYTARRLGAQTLLPPPAVWHDDVIGIMTGDGTVLVWPVVSGEVKDLNRRMTV